jgi:hypothetical protein
MDVEPIQLTKNCKIGSIEFCSDNSSFVLLNTEAPETTLPSDSYIQSYGDSPDNADLSSELSRSEFLKLFTFPDELIKNISNYNNLSALLWRF